MAVITTKAIVLSSLKYGDTSLIVKCLTLQEGIKSYMIKGVLKAKKGKLKPAYFQPLTQLNLVANHNSKSSLNAIKEGQVVYPYETVHTSVVKQTIMLFLSEVLSSILQEEEENVPLYNYIETSLIWLDTHSHVANFHLLFLLNLTKYLGFYPDTSNIEKETFNLLDGRFTNVGYEKLTLSGKEIALFKSMLGINFDTINSISYSKKERQTILQIIVEYYELHLEGFRRPKSLNVLETVFN
ncbi:DNA repair protein RecO [Tenacibaculum tangerinum]|uniref:DNA repair protein RecO n=1 Tax=Tenacibaculum tangerinum TaxID=3038772 RepID=A0ABY8L4E8_9FLAO|nr:DNA repair protein RecO [Tenacibaculum tangerinum]WGH74780.1 DNA repair protein RecO [Tenacibaculum tangerinum]